MAIHKLRQLDGDSAGVTLPKKDLRDSGFLDEDGCIDGEQYAVIEQVEPGEWRIRAVNGLFD